MATYEEREDLKHDRIEGVQTLQRLGAMPADVDPYGEEATQLGPWPAGSIKERAEQVGLAHMSQADGENFLNHGVHEESVSLVMERMRGTRIADDLVDAAPRAQHPDSVIEQGQSLKQRSLKSFWNNREELIQTIKDHPGFQLGNRALTALVALDEDGRITQMLDDPRAKLAVLAVKEAHAGINDPSKSRISKMLSGEQEATDVVLETAGDFVPAKTQPFVQPAVKAAQSAIRMHNEGKASQQSGRSVADQLNMQVDQGKSAQADQAARQRRMTQMLNADPEASGAQVDSGHEFE